MAITLTFAVTSACAGEHVNVVATLVTPQGNKGFTYVIDPETLKEPALDDEIQAMCRLLLKIKRSQLVAGATKLAIKTAIELPITVVA